MKNKTKVESIIKASKAAEILGVSRETLNVWTKAGNVPCFYTLGGHARYRLSDIEKLAEIK
jgi:predicted site-specific integrase-resolvase